MSSCDKVLSFQSVLRQTRSLCNLCEGLSLSSNKIRRLIILFFLEVDAHITVLLEFLTHSKMEWVITTVILQPPFLTILYVGRTF